MSPLERLRVGVSTARLLAQLKPSLLVKASDFVRMLREVQDEPVLQDCECIVDVTFSRRGEDAWRA